MSVVKIAKPGDLLGCKPIATQIKEHGEETVQIEVRVYVEKCAMALNIQMGDMQVATLCEDIIETYKYDSIEDVRECLKNGRRGLYGFGHNSRNSLNMILIREWMAQHLEKKSIEREKQNAKSKDKQIEPLPEVDYEAYKSRTKEDPKKKANQDYNNFKAKYFSEKEVEIKTQEGLDLDGGEAEEINYEEI